MPLLTIFRASPWIAILLLIGIVTAQSSQIHKWHTQAIHSEEARQRDQATYVQAQKDAAQTNIAQVQKVEQQYQRNSENERQAYLSDLAKLRAMRVRPQAPAAPGPTDPASPPAPDASTPRIDDIGVCVPATSDVCEAGAEIELRLMHLQNLLEQQTQVNPNK